MAQSVITAAPSRLAKLLCVRPTPKNLFALGTSSTVLQTDDACTLANAAALVWLSLVVSRAFLSIMDQDTHVQPYTTIGAVLCDKSELPQALVGEWYAALAFDAILCIDNRVHAHLAMALNEPEPEMSLAVYGSAIEKRLYGQMGELKRISVVARRTKVKRLARACLGWFTKDYDTVRRLEKPIMSMTEDELAAGVPIPMGSLPPHEM